MFRKTRIRLVLFNAIVLILLLNGLGSAVYFSMKYRLYSQADGKLLQIAKHIRDTPFPFLKMERKRWSEIDRRTIVLFWDKEGQIIGNTHGEIMDQADLDQFRTTTGTEGFTTLTVNGQPYRILTATVHKVVNAEGILGKAQTFQIVYNLGPEEEMLDSLLYVISIGGAISIIIAVLTGLFLAKKALIPIQLSWEKQQQFVADASHELRTPLSVIQVHLERLFRYPDHTIEQESENILVGIQETRRLNKLVSDLLTLARSDSNEIQLIKKRMKLNEVVTKSVQAFQQLATVKDIQIQTHMEELLEIVADEERIHQLLVILLDNALKYTQAKGLITVSCRREGNWITLAVADTGIGIAKEDIPYIFDRFFQSDKMRSGVVEGAGLGLSIAKWIVEAHGGKIRVESEEGAGSCFYVNLPLRGKR